jgi:hypothetical protein
MYPNFRIYVYIQYMPPATDLYIDPSGQYTYLQGASNFKRIGPSRLFLNIARQHSTLIIDFGVSYATADERVLWGTYH